MNIEREGAVRRLVVSIDTARDLAPQVALYRSIGIPWKLLCELAGRRKQTLERAIDRWMAATGKQLEPGQQVGHIPPRS